MTIVAANDPDEDTLFVSLSGTGTAPAPLIEISADLLDFGAFEQEQTITRQLTIYNAGLLDLAIEEINISGNSGFSTTFSDATIVPYDSVAVDFQFYTEDNITEAFATATIVAANADNMDISLRAGNLSPSAFDLSQPENNAEIYIDESNMNDSTITFSWYESSDANGDSLYYLMRATSAEIGNHDLDTNATSIDVSYMDIIYDMAENNVTVATLEWTVHVTDGIDTVEATNAPFTVMIDGGDAMSIYLESLLPDKFALHQNYPNPFNPVTTLRYDLPENSLVNIIIYDLLGRQVKSLINQTQDAGFKSIIWNATNDYGKPVSAGVYLYQIQAGEFVQTKKMVLLK